MPVPLPDIPLVLKSKEFGQLNPYLIHSILMIHKSIPQGTYWVNLYLKPPDLCVLQIWKLTWHIELPVFQWQITFITRCPNRIVNANAVILWASEWAFCLKSQMFQRSSYGFSDQDRHPPTAHHQVFYKSWFLYTGLSVIRKKQTWYLKSAQTL